jgi:hypothetical protein
MTGSAARASLYGGGLARSMRPAPTKAPLSSPSIASRTFSSIVRDILARTAEGGQRRLAQLVAAGVIKPISDPNRPMVWPWDAGLAPG